ncbi:hypothetical protein [Desulfosarcina sp. BuS5]|uniref:hypothetical protein n=1 Tax=Desulfosarcina sp. BuS5 TaxID=933262 RepID=UPI002378290F|nr:hypothetical protein [Desulfosarcina sp. BuS5]
MNNFFGTPQSGMTARLQAIFFIATKWTWSIPMDEATLFDSFFNYLQGIQVFPFLEHLDPKNQRRKNIPFAQILLVYLMKVVGSIKKMDQMTDLLLTDELLMSMCGFNAYQVKNGSCDTIQIV